MESRQGTASSDLHFSRDNGGGDGTRMSDSYLTRRRALSPRLGRIPLQIRMVAGCGELLQRKEQLIAEACNHPNCLVLPFRLELIRLVV